MSEKFSTEDRHKVISIYHQYDNDKSNLWSKVFADIQKEFNVTLDPQKDGEVFRSWFKRQRKTLDPLYSTQQVLLSPTVLTEEKLALQAERFKYRDQKNALTKVIREQSRFEYIRESIMLGAIEVAKTKPLFFCTQYTKNIDELSNKEAALLLGDWHVGLEVDNFLNKYSVEICRSRLQRLVEKVIQHIRLHQVKKVHVFDLGDMICGNIHNSLRSASNEDVISQVMIVCELMAEVIARLANEVPEVHVYSVTDNHSRILPNKNDVQQKESFARIIPFYLKPRLSKFTNVTIMDGLDSEIAVADIMGYTVFAVHGHNDSVRTVVADLSLMIKKFPDYVFMAHYHHNAEDETHSCDVVVNPSLAGVEEHAKGIRRTSKPAQKLLIFTEEGRECTYSINLGEKKSR